MKPQSIFFSVLLVAALCVDPLSATSHVEKPTPISLTAKERAFIKTHPVITAHNESNYPPYNFITAPIDTLKLDAADFVHNQGRFSQRECKHKSRTRLSEFNKT